VRRGGSGGGRGGGVKLSAGWRGQRGSYALMVNLKGVAEEHERHGSDLHMRVRNTQRRGETAAA
jgi:hypothetical protein